MWLSFFLSLGMLHAGYKLMHLKCIQSGLEVTQKTAQHLLQILDPQGAQLRQGNRLRRRLYTHPGPNLLWHGIRTNGAVEGFSRVAMWEHAYTTNSDPRVISGYFIDEIEDRSSTPTTKAVFNSCILVNNIYVFFPLTSSPL